MSDHHIERISPTQSTLQSFFESYPDHKQRYEFALLYLNKSHRVADIACGVGYGTWMMSDYCSHVVGYDLSSEAIEHARENFSKENTEFFATDTMPVATYDIIISFETIEHMDEENGDKFLQTIRRAMKDDGLLIISTPINKSEKKHNVTPFHIREYDDVEFGEKIIANGFDVVDFFGQGSEYHKKLYGKNRAASINIFKLMKTGVHRIIPAGLRKLLKSKMLGDPNVGLSISRDNWQDSAVQIAVCRKSSI